jgi:hypothetical protein
MSASIRVTTRFVRIVRPRSEKPFTEVTAITNSGASRIARSSRALKASKAALIRIG